MQKKDPFTGEHITVAVLLGWLVWFFMFCCYYGGFREHGIQGGYSVVYNNVSVWGTLFQLAKGFTFGTIINAAAAYFTAKTSNLFLKIVLYTVTFAVVIVGPIYFTYSLYINDRG